MGVPLAVSLALAILVLACEPAIAGTESSYRAEVQAHQADVSARLAGLIKRVTVHDDQVVAQGDVLVELDDREPRARVATAQAQLDARRSERQTAQAARKTAPANRLEITQAELDLANAKVLAAEAGLELARFDLQHTTVTAEIGGMVTLHGIAPGQSIQRGQSLATIVDLDGVWLDAFFTETQVANVELGQPADITVATPARKVALHGTVDEVKRDDAALVHAVVDTGAVGQARVGVGVKINLDNYRRDKSLRPGMSASVTIHTRR